MGSLPEGLKNAPSGLICSIYGGGNPSKVATDEGNQPRGLRDGSPGMVTRVFTDEQLAPSEPDKKPHPNCYQCHSNNDLTQLSLII